MSWQYYGLFLDKESRNKLITFLQNSKWDYLFEETSKVYLDHCTLLHKFHNKLNLTKLLDKYLNCEFTIHIIGIGISEKAIAFKVEPIGLSSANKIPHITIGTFSNGKPVDSNYITKWIPFKNYIEVNSILKII